MSRRCLPLALGLALLGGIPGSMAGCGHGAGSESDRPQIGIYLPTTATPRWRVAGDTMATQLQAMGYRPEVQQAGNNPDKQAAQVDSGITRRVKVIIVGAVSGARLAAVLDRAAQTHIPVISYERLIRDTEGVTCFASYDNYLAGVLQATYIEEHLGLRSGRGPFHIELFAGSMEDISSYRYFSGAMGVLQPYLDSGQLVVRSGLTRIDQVATGDQDGTEARTRMASTLSAHYAQAHLDAVLSPQDVISRGVLIALEYAGYGPKGQPLPIITGQDADADSVKMIIAGLQAQTVFQDPRPLAMAAAAMARDLVRGKQPAVNDLRAYHNGAKVVPTYLLQPVSIDLSNYRQALVDSGYYQPVALGI